MIAPSMSRLLKASLLFFFLAVCGSSFFIAHHVRERPPAPVPRALFAIVNEQVTAFRTANFQGAYRHAATGVQQKFTLPQFERMVRQSYPEITQAQRVEFGLVKMQGGSALMQVFFFSNDDTVRLFLYSLTREDDSWKIEGVTEVNGYRAGDRLAGTHV